MKKLIILLLYVFATGFLAPLLAQQAFALAGNTVVVTGNMTEEEKVTHLLNYIRTLNGAIFIRNGKEFKPTEAADHLRSKWEKHKKRVKTAHGFVDRLATESTTHEPYQIRFSDGRIVKCGDLLNEELRRIEE